MAYKFYGKTIQLTCYPILSHTPVIRENSNIFATEIQYASSSVSLLSHAKSYNITKTTSFLLAQAHNTTNMLRTQDICFIK